MTLRSTLVLLLLVPLLACGGASNEAAPSATPTPATASAGPLDGASYDITLELPGEPALKDTLNFANGRLESATCTDRGFPKGTAYTAQAAGDATGFHSLTKHPDGTTMDWTGNAKGNAVEGTATRTMNGKTVTGTFKGSRRP